MSNIEQRDLMMGKKAARIVVACFGFAVVTALAVSLGDIEVRSNLGQPLEARIALRSAEGAEIVSECVSLLPRDLGKRGDIDLLVDARATVRQAGTSSYIAITTAEPISDPAVRFVLKLSCGEQGSFYREFTLLLDPPGFAKPAPVQLPTLSAEVAASAQGKVSEYVVQDGDTLASISASIYPGNRKAQRLLRRAIVKANSDVLPSTRSPLPVAGTPLLIPELAQVPAAQPSKPRPKRVARKKSQPQSVASTEREEFIAAPRERQIKVRAERATGFVLKLSRGSLDVTAGQALSENERQALRERQKLLDADDQTANILALQHALRQMQAEIAELRAQLGKPAPAAAVPAPVISAAAPSAPVTPAPVAPAPSAVEQSTPAAPLPSTPQPSAPAKPAPAQREVVAQAPSSQPAPAAVLDDAEKRIVYESRGFMRWVYDHKGMLLLLAVALGGLLMLRRRQQQTVADTEFAFETKSRKGAAVGPKRPAATQERSREPAAAAAARPSARAREQGEKSRPDVRVEPKTAPAKLDAAARDINDRYLAERFPEIVESKLNLGDADAVIAQAQTYFLEDGDADKTVEFLEHVVANNPGEPKIWFALLELLRQVRLKGAYEKAAQQFKQVLPDPAHWARVCAMGQTLDPDNPLYRTAEVPLVEDVVAKPVFAQENWLDLPLDFTPEESKQDALRSELLAALPAEHEPGLTLEPIIAPEAVPEPTLNPVAAPVAAPEPATPEGHERGSMIERAMRDKGLPS